ncbi:MULTISPECIES: Gfo/Idh/MocA family oxidoreductase [unclassified Bradyrhizobium]|uniref:Gfo/Idh/MocA family protein n=1 Tax=unclassified Bradyrhizobium TaxID=2631580 RepID=UPI0029166E4F|nr:MULTISPECIES: Gfo/Idh/MocA family oxidoreductase [unclassified Bradyrhizobium]
MMDRVSGLPIQSGLVGCGEVARNHAMAMRKGDAFRLRSVYDQDYPRARAFASSFEAECQESLDDLFRDENELLCICTPNATHRDYVEMSLQAGMHVVVEHPLALSGEEARRLATRAARSGRRVFVVRQRRFLRSVQLLRNVIATGMLGPPVGFRASMIWSRRDTYFEEKRWQAGREGGGVITNQASHFIDILQYIVGPLQPSSVLTANLRHNMAACDSVYANLNARTSSGTFFATVAAPDGMNDGSFVVEFEKRSLRLTGKGWQSIAGLTVAEEATLEQMIAGPVTGDHSCYLERVSSVLNGEEMEVVEAESAIATTELIELLNGVAVSNAPELREVLADEVRTMGLVQT